METGIIKRPQNQDWVFSSFSGFLLKNFDGRGSLVQLDFVHGERELSRIGLIVLFNSRFV